MQETAEHYREGLIEPWRKPMRSSSTPTFPRVLYRLKRSGVASASAHSTPRSSPSCAGGLRNKGIQPLLDAVIEYLPAPPDLPP